MKFADHLSKEQIQRFNQLKRTVQKKQDEINTPLPKNEKKQSEPKPKKKKEEKVNWNEIMGKYRDTYVRRNGAVRRK